MSSLSDSQDEAEQREDEQCDDQRGEEEPAAHQAVAGAGCAAGT
jgi:hypothetical protein